MVSAWPLLLRTGGAFSQNLWNAHSSSITVLNVVIRYLQLGATALLGPREFSCVLFPEHHWCFSEAINCTDHWSKTHSSVLPLDFNKQTLECSAESREIFLSN
jgi:hypothetical protein